MRWISPGLARCPGTRLVAFAAALIDRSGTAPVIEAALAHATGRPRPLPVRAVLTALLSLALDDRPLFLTEATRLLFSQLSPASRQLLAVPGTATTERAFLAAYRRVRYCFGQILKVADPSALPKNRRLTEARAQGPHQTDDPRSGHRRPGPARGAGQCAAGGQRRRPHRRRAGRLRRLHRPGRHPRPAIQPRPSKRTGLSASDPDGGWYVREGDHRDREDDKGKPLRKLAWALEATIAATARPPGAPPAHPNLAIGLAWPGPAKTPAAPAPACWPPWPPAATSPAALGYDRAYTQALPERFHLPSARWATSQSWTTGRSARHPGKQPAEPSWSRAPGTAPPCPGR